MVSGNEYSCLKLYDKENLTKKQKRKIKKALLRLEQGKSPPKCKLYKKWSGASKARSVISQKVIDFIENKK